MIDLNFEGWLLRSADSNGVEVEIMADDKRMPFNRWQIQCRNANHVDMGEIATAIGRSVSVRPTVLLSVTTGQFTQQARHYATRAMQLTNFQVLLIDTHDLQAMASGEKRIESILDRETGQVKAAKQPQLTPLYAQY